jgi:ELWxxDGT repeat protein
MKIKDVSANYLTAMGDSFFFAGEDSVNGIGLWKSDGTRSGTKNIKVFNTGGAHELPNGFIDAGGTLYFCAYEISSGWELWKSDGTETGTTMITDLNNGPDNGVPEHYCSLAFLDQKIFFVGKNDSSKSFALWKTDGSSLNTTMVRDIRPQSRWGLPSGLFVMGDTLFFTGSDGVNGTEWWKCEGPGYEENDVSMVKNINPNGNGVDEFGLHVVLGSYFYFPGNGGASGRELWRSNGTEAGTTLFKEINPSGDGYPGNLTIVEDNFYFTARDGTHGFELWKSNGSKTGTFMVKDINSSGGSQCEYLTPMGSEVFFVADDGTRNDIWKSDGTKKGTIKITNINPLYDFDPRSLTQFRNSIFFRADDGITGSEFWKTDGSVGNAELVANIMQGSESSWPGNLFVFKDALYFRATYDNSVSEGEGDGLYRYGDIATTCFSWNLFLPAILTNVMK